MSNLDECAICLEDNNNLDNIIFECNHSFHYTCYIEWLKHNNNSNICPTCNIFQEISTIIDPEIKLIDNKTENNIDNKTDRYNNVININDKKKCLKCIIL